MQRLQISAGGFGPDQGIGGWVVRHTHGRGPLLGASLLVGAGAGLGAVAFRELIIGVTRLVTGRRDYAGLGRVPSTHLTFLGPFFLLLAPAVGGLIYGPLVQRFAPEARGHGVPEVMYAVQSRGGRIAAPVAAVKALASAICIGTGGSVGREGPIVQIGSALGSTVGRILRLPPAGLRLLVACGAAGGIAATFNAPIAGVFFSLELILGDFAAESFGLVVLAAVVASVIGRAAFGSAAFLTLPAFTVHHTTEYVLYAAVGLIGGAVGVGFTRVLYAVEDGCDAVWARTRLPEWARPGVGGLLLGGLLLALPEMYGVGYPVLSRSVAGGYGAAFLLLLLAGKVVATSLTIGIGGSGGVFAPSLFCGAVLGDAIGKGLHAAIPGVVSTPGSYALIGMAAVFAGAARAPITAVLILFELTGEYTIILPLMLAVVAATAISRVLSEDTIYTLKLRRRGDLPSATAQLTAGDVALPMPHPLTTDALLADAARRLTAESRTTLPVVGTDGHYQGVLTAEALEDNATQDTNRAARGNGSPRAPLTVGDLAGYSPTVKASDSLRHVAAVLGQPDATGGVVVLDHDGAAIGWLDHEAVLRSLFPPAS